MKRVRSTASLNDFVTFRSRILFVVLAVLGILALSVPLGAHAIPAAAANPNPTWNVDARILFRA